MLQRGDSAGRAEGREQGHSQQSSPSPTTSLPHSILDTLSRWVPRRYHLTIKLAADTILIAAAALWAWIVTGQRLEATSAIMFVLAILAIRLTIYAALGLWRGSWRCISPQDVLQLYFSAVLGMPAVAAVLYLLPVQSFGLMHPGIVLLTEPVFYALFLSTARMVLRMYSNPRGNGNGAKRTLIVGAGSAGQALGYLLGETGDEHTVVGYLDDDPLKQRQRIRGRAILGKIEDAPRIVQQHRVELIVIAIPSLDSTRLRQILVSLEFTGLPVRTVPRIDELVTQQAHVGELRELSMEDLLPRAAVSFDQATISQYLKGKTVLITGGGGSIGRCLCKEVMAAGAKRLLVLGHGENSVFESVIELHELQSDCELIPLICSIRDRMGLEQAFARFRPQVVFHAAAHKHVPLMEIYPAEAIKTNVIGTLNVVELAVQYNVERLVLVSTDKAVNPVNVMGASKRVAELIVKAYAESAVANMVSVRFGNVLGSRGSVVPIITRQVQRRQPVTITDPGMVRYFMTIPEAVQLILQAGANGGRGETYILKMGYQVRIMDLAYDLIRLAGLTPNVDIPIKITGFRPGEKLKEELFTHIENECVQVNEHFYVVPSQPVELSELLSDIEELRRAAQHGNRSHIVALLCKLIPDFVPSKTALLDVPASPFALAEPD